uniref:Conotoxin n=1 Tax=Conus betulinus TaxID=89764 RepID=A0A142C1N0_CONBE|nr:conotoxin [Conus betulinus]
MKTLTILILVATALLSTHVMVGGEGEKPLMGRNAANRLLASMRGKRCKTRDYLCQRDEECCSGLDCRCTVHSNCSPPHIQCK